MRFIILILSVLTFVSPAVAEEPQTSVSAEVFGQLPRIDGVQLSPDGTRMAMLQSYKGAMTLTTTGLRQGEVGTFYTIPFKEGRYNWFRWLTNDRLAASIRFPEERLYSNTTEGRLLAFEWDASEQINLVKRQRIKGYWAATSRTWISQFQDKVVSFLPDDPDHILLALDDFDNINRPDVYRVNIHDAERKMVQKTMMNVRDWRADPKGVVRLGMGFNELNQYYLVYRKGEGERWTTLFEIDLLHENPPFEFEAFTEDPNVLYVFASDDDGHNALYRYDVDAATLLGKVFEDEQDDIAAVEFDKDGKILTYTTSGANARTVYIDKKLKSIGEFAGKNFPGENVHITSSDEAGSKYIVYVSSPQNPGDYYLLDLKNKTMNRFAEKYPGLDRSKLAPMQPVSYRSRDGIEISGYLSLPAGKDPKKVPTVILPHGEQDSEAQWEFDYWVQFLTTRGYAVLQMNYRGAGMVSARADYLGEQEWDAKMLDDINDGTHWMIDQGYSDPDHICIMGGGYGGFAALQAPIMEQGLYGCVVAFAPITDMSGFLWERRKFMGQSLAKNYQRNRGWSFGDMSPDKNLDKIDFPVLLAHGTEDRRVPFDQGEDFAKKMKKEGKDITFLKFEEGDHFLSRQEHRVAFLKAVEKFLAKHLGGEVH